MKTSESKYAMCLYFATNALARKTEKLAQACWSKVGLTPSHAYLLMLVNERPGLQPTVIAAELQLSPSTVTRLIAKLEDKKLVVRITEGKITNVYSSPKGKALTPRLQLCQEEFYLRTLGLLGKERSEELVKTVGRAADQIGG
ncbi:MAG: MarR family transcriptional regulator [Flavitalea sp.]